MSAMKDMYIADILHTYAHYDHINFENMYICMMSIIYTN